MRIFILLFIPLLVIITSCSDVVDTGKDNLQSIEYLKAFVEEQEITNGKHYIDRGIVEFDVKMTTSFEAHCSFIEKIAQRESWDVNPVSSNEIVFNKIVNIYGETYENVEIRIEHDSFKKVVHYKVD